MCSLRHREHRWRHRIGFICFGNAAEILLTPASHADIINEMSFADGRSLCTLSLALLLGLLLSMRVGISVG